MKINKGVSNEGIKKSLRDSRGQSLIEVIIGLTIGALIIGGVSAGLVSSLRSNMQTKQDITAVEIAQKTMDNVRALAESDWGAIYSKSGESVGVEGAPCYPAVNGGVFSISTDPNAAGVDKPEIAGVIYEPKFTVSKVGRDSSGKIDAVGVEDPSTQKITVSVSWKTIGTNERTISIVSYVTRTKNISALFTDWSVGSGVEGPVTSANNGFSSSDNLDYSVQGQIKVSGY